MSIIDIDSVVNSLSLGYVMKECEIKEKEAWENGGVGGP